MKLASILIIPILGFVSAASIAADDAPSRPAESGAGVIRVATSLDHLTVLEFSEPVTMAAAGSSAFEIERHENKVLIKPLKTGAATDLFVWTASRRFTYELLPPGEVQNMNFAIDSPLPQPKPAPITTPMDGVADMMLTRALLGAERIDSSSLKDNKRGVTVRIEHVFRTRSTIYVHYSVRNLGSQPCALTSPEVMELGASRPAIPLDELQRRQLSEQQLHALGQLTTRPLSVAHFEAQNDRLLPQTETQGVIALRAQIEGVTTIQLRFKLEGNPRQGEARATVVF